MKFFLSPRDKQIRNGIVVVFFSMIRVQYATIKGSDNRTIELFGNNTAK